LRGRKLTDGRPLPWSVPLRTGFVVIRTIALGLRIGLAHVLTLFGLAVPTVA
jgi:hypothetical protein